MKSRYLSKRVAWMCAVLCCINTTFAQEISNHAEITWFQNASFYQTNSFYSGDNMIADSHKTYSFGADFKLEIVRYENFGLTLFTGISGLRVDDTQMIGNVKKSTQIKGGGTLLYQWDITKKSTLKPEFGIYRVSMRSSSSANGTKIKPMLGMGYLVGTEYQYNITKGFRGVVGLHYHWNSYNVKTDPQYKKYFEQARFIQLSVGFNF